MDLNTILIIVGIVALVALIVHGLWSNRREKSKYFDKKSKFERSPQAPSHYESNPVNEPLHMEPRDVNTETSQVQSSVNSLDDIKIYIPEPQEKQRQPEEIHYPRPNERVKDYSSMTLGEVEQHADPVEGISTSSRALREQLEDVSTQSSDYVMKNTQIQEQPKQTSGFIQLYVISPLGREFLGVSLIQSLENLGFIAGRNGLFHKHMDLCDASPVLFSAANLQNNGQFDVHHPSEFSTVGISLFMQLPSPGNDKKNLGTMIYCAKTLAKELGGTVLTEDEAIFDEKTEKSYLARVA